MMLDRIRGLRHSTLARNTGWVLAGQAVSILLQLTSFLIIARLLGSAQYGIYIGAVALVSIAAQFSTLGSGMVFVRHVSQQHQRFAIYWCNILLITAISGSTCLLILELLGRHLIGPASAALLLITAVGDFFGARLVDSASQVFQAFEELRFTAALSISTSALRCMAALILWLHFHTVNARQWALASMLVSLVAAACAVVFVSLRCGLPRFQKGLLASSLGEGFGYSVAFSTTSLYNDLDKTMLSHYGMNTANGAYTIAYRFVDMCTIPIRALHTAALPRFFRSGVHGVEATGAFGRSLLHKTVSWGVVSAIGIWLVAPLLPFALGKSFALSTPALRWLALLPLIRSLHLSAGDALTGAGHQKYRTASQFLAAGANFFLNLWMIPAFGWRGAAWSSLITDGMLALGNWITLTYLTNYAQEETRLSAVSTV